MQRSFYSVCPKALWDQLDGMHDGLLPGIVWNICAGLAKGIIGYGFLHTVYHDNPAYYDEMQYQQSNLVFLCRYFIGIISLP